MSHLHTREIINTPQLDLNVSEMNDLQHPGLESRSTTIQQINNALLISVATSTLAFIILSIYERNLQYLIGTTFLIISGLLVYPILLSA